MESNRLVRGPNPTGEGGFLGIVYILTGTVTNTSYALLLSMSNSGTRKEDCNMLHGPIVVSRPRLLKADPVNSDGVGILAAVQSGVNAPSQEFNPASQVQKLI